MNKQQLIIVIECQLWVAYKDVKKMGKETESLVQGFIEEYEEFYEGDDIEKVVREKLSYMEEKYIDKERD